MFNNNFIEMALDNKVTDYKDANTEKEKAVTIAKAPQEKIINFLQEYYKADIEKAYNDIYGENKNGTLVIDYELLNSHDANKKVKGLIDIADLLIENPAKTIEDFNKAIKTVAINPKKDVEIKVAFTNVDFTPLKNVLGKKVDKFIETKGVVKGVGEIKPKPQIAYYICNKCATTIAVVQTTDQLTPPKACTNCENKSFTYDYATFIDTREIILEEALEDTKTRTPRRMLVKLDDNLIYNVDTGNRVKVAGIVETIEKNKNLHYIINANNITPLEINKINLTAEDIAEIKQLLKDENILNRLIKSLAPSLIIEPVIKLSILCYLVKGINPNEDEDAEDLDNIRDFIHILLITDPAMAKSKLAKHVDYLAEHSAIFNGANSSGAGLTAAAIRDEITGAWIIEAGVIPTYHKGHVIIDEFDKIEEKEQKKLLQFKEHGEDTIAKVGLTERLKGETGILSLANFKYGKYNQFKSITDQVEIYDALLSRQDLIFIMQDKPNKEKDDLIAKAVLGINSLEEDKDADIIPKELLRKTLAYVSKLKPKESDEAKLKALNWYNETRQNTNTDDLVIPTDARMLNTIKRLSGAIAKLQAHTTVTAEDIEIAIALKTESLKSAGYDPETKTLDINKYYGIYTNAQTRNSNLVLKVINDYVTNEDIDGHELGIPKHILKNNLDLKGMKKDTFYNTYNELLKDGRIIETGTGKEKRVFTNTDNTRLM